MSHVAGLEKTLNVNTIIIKYYIIAAGMSFCLYGIELNYRIKGTMVWNAC